VPSAVSHAIVIDPRQKSTRSRLFRPSAMISYALDQARARFLELPGPYGTIRTTYGWHLCHTRTRGEFMSAVRAIHQQSLPFIERGAQVIAGFYGTPEWLTDGPIDRTPVGGSGWPRFAIDPPRGARVAEYAALAAEVAQVGGSGVLLELWNEPGFDVFASDLPALFVAVDAAAAAVRRAGLRCIGMSNALWNDPRAGDSDRRPVLQRWLERRPAIDGVSWHCYQGFDPAENTEGFAQVRRWLQAAGYRSDLPQWITEWGRWTTWPEVMDPSRDEEEHAAACATALLNFQRAGAAGATITCLEGFERPTWPGQGTFGMLGWDGQRLFEKPVFALQRILSRLSDTVYGFAMADRLTRSGVNILPTSSGCLLWRHQRDSGETLRVRVSNRLNGRWLERELPPASFMYLPLPDLRAPLRPEGD
jgi:hypothetical protein